jgi:hypothetical protein
MFYSSLFCHNPQENPWLSLKYEQGAENQMTITWLSNKEIINEGSECGLRFVVET